MLSPLWPPKTKAASLVWSGTPTCPVTGPMEGPLGEILFQEEYEQTEGVAKAAMAKIRSVFLPVGI